MRLLPPPPDSWYTSFFILADPGTLHENAVPAFSSTPLGRANTVYFLSPISAPPISINVYYLFFTINLLS